MSCRRQTANRLTLYRECAICGQRILTSADTPWMRMVEERDEDGKRHQRTKYYCSSSCFQASYKHIGWYDGKAEERRKLRELNRDKEKRSEQWKRYYAKNGERIRAKRMQRYWENHEEELKDNQFQRAKRKKLRGGSTVEQKTARNPLSLDMGSRAAQTNDLRSNHAKL